MDVVLTRTRVCKTKMYVYPSKLRFAQDSICRYFRNGSSLQDTLEDLLESDCPEDFFPPMSVMEHQGKYFVVEGNRRLLLLKILESHGLVGKVPVKLSPFNSFKFTTENDGTCIEVRGYPDMEEELESIVEGEHSEYEDSDDETDFGFDDLALSDEGTDSQDDYDGDEDTEQSEDEEDDESDDDESDDGSDSDETDDGRGRDDEYADVEESDTEEYDSEGGDYDDSDSEEEEEEEEEEGGLL
ncbi:prostatic spermine-binding protein-like [Gigantopelta aegis]|uniref:prostatic spermine-binding protein-like n=1 Tax=Gigantopelta aegis TaxID=1735272 RepID=UPI001B889093|nr:prostatic spermine-binding protein-like [Gigantopelta aegis]